jgi:ATP-dependent DNA helicase RecQ
LQARGSLVANEHGGLMLGGDAKAILKGEQRIDLIQPPKTERATRKARNAEANPVGDPLFDALRELRRKLAGEAGVPPYVIFHDSTLREMAAQRPRSDADLEHISGIGARKRAAYGPAFLETIASFAEV